MRKLPSLATLALRDPALVDMHAIVMLSSAATAVRDVLDRRAAMDRAGLADAPLVVVAGEYHNRPAHIVHHMMVMDGLMRHEPLAVAMEYDHTIAASFYAAWNDGISGGARRRLAREDRNGALSLQAQMSGNGLLQAAHTRAMMFGHQLQAGVPTRFTDTASIGAYVSPDDSSSVASLAACIPYGRAIPLVNAVSPDGMMVRNHHMARLGAIFAQAAHARILYQQTGNAHVAGYAPMRLSGRTSLSAQFKARGMHVLALPHAPEDLGKDHGLSDAELKPLPQLPDVDAQLPCDDAHSARVQGLTLHPALCEGHDSILRTLRLEATYTNALLRQSGMPEFQRTPPQIEALRDDCERALDSSFRRISAFSPALRVY